MESMEMWELLKEKLMELPEKERERALSLLLEVLDFIIKNPGEGAPGSQQ